MAPWCSGLTCQPVTLEIEGSNPFGVGSNPSILEARILGKASKRTKNPKGTQLTGQLAGDLLAFFEVGLYQRGVSDRSRYRYRGILLRYQEFLQGEFPSLDASIGYLVWLRKSGLAPATVKLSRSVLATFHEWRGEKLKYKVKVPRSEPPYVDTERVINILDKANENPNPKYWTAVALMAYRGLREGEVAKINVADVNLKQGTFRYIAKGSIERSRSIPDHMRTAITKLCQNKKPTDKLIGLSASGIYKLVKRLDAEFHPHLLRHWYVTRGLELGALPTEMKSLAGHANLSTTSRYAGVSQQKVDELEKYLDTVMTAGSTQAAPATFPSQPDPVEPTNVSPREKRYSMARKIDRIKKEGEAGIESQKELIHQQQIQEVAQKLAESISLPSYWDKDMWKDLPIEFRPGKYSLPIGTVEINRDIQIKVKYPDIASGIAEPHLVRGLYDHLATSGLLRFSELAGDKGKLDDWAGEVARYSEALLKFLVTITEEVKNYRAKVCFYDEAKPGLTKWFVITAWNDALQTAGSRSWIEDSWYKTPEDINGAGLLQLKCGAYSIGIANSKKTIKLYENWHKKLRATYAEHQSAKDIHAMSRELDNIAQDIRQRLQEFSDMQHLPGHCDLCASEQSHV